MNLWFIVHYYIFVGFTKKILIFLSTFLKSIHKMSGFQHKGKYKFKKKGTVVIKSLLCIGHVAFWHSSTPCNHAIKSPLWYLKPSRISYSSFVRNLFQKHVVEMFLKKHFLNNIMYSSADWVICLCLLKEWQIPASNQNSKHFISTLTSYVKSLIQN